jgi:hypothetical protein
MQTYKELWYYFSNYIYPNPPCQLSLWEETGAPGENPRLSAERWLTLSRESVARIEPTISEVKDACSDHCATEAPVYTLPCTSIPMTDVRFLKYWLRLVIISPEIHHLRARSEGVGVGRIVKMLVIVWKYPKWSPAFNCYSTYSPPFFCSPLLSRKALINKHDTGCLLNGCRLVDQLACPYERRLVLRAKKSLVLRAEMRLVI